MFSVHKERRLSRPSAMGRGVLVSGKVFSHKTHIADLLQSFIDQKSHSKWGRTTLGQIFTLGLVDDTFLWNRMVEFCAKSGDLRNAHKIFERIPQKNIYSWNAIINACVKHGYIDDAHLLFAEMPERNIISWNIIIGGFSQSDYYVNKSLILYKEMNMGGFRPSQFTLASVLSAAGKLENFEMGSQCHSQIVKAGFESDLYVVNALLCMYAKCGLLANAYSIFDGMTQPNEISCTALMSGLALTDQVYEAFHMFRKMHATGVHLDAVALSSIIGICAKSARVYNDKYALDQALEVSVSSNEKEVFPFAYYAIESSLGAHLHCLAVKFGHDLDLLVGNCLIGMYAKFDNMDDAKSVFENMPQHNTVSWNIMIAGYGETGQAEKAIKMMQLMQDNDFKPDEVTYGSLLGVFVKTNDLDTARILFDRMANVSLTSWNTIITGYCQKEDNEEALKLFRRMQSSGVRPDRTTIAVILSSCAGLGLLHFGKQVHAASLKALLHHDVFVGSGLVDMYSKCKNIDIAKSIFVRMVERDVVGWNSMMNGLILHSLHEEAYIVFKEMLEEGIHPTHFSYTSILSSCARLSSLAQGKQVHSHVIKDGFLSDVFVGSALIDMYAKSGSVEQAYNCFSVMQERNVVCWNEMINGFSQSGRGKEAIQLFERMLWSSEKPDGITFVSVMSACSHCGMVEEAVQYFNSMKEDHQIIPLADHYACLVDSLGRAGRLEEAEKILTESEYKSDPVTLGVLLGACRVHANISVGKRVAEKLFQIEPHNPSSYVLLANICAGLGMWEEASNIRKLMNDRRLAKDHAYSWIESKNRVHDFMVGDDMTLTEQNQCVAD